MLYIVTHMIVCKGCVEVDLLVQVQYSSTAVNGCWCVRDTELVISVVLSWNVWNCLLVFGCTQVMESWCVEYQPVADTVWECGYTCDRGLADKLLSSWHQIGCVRASNSPADHWVNLARTMILPVRPGHHLERGKEIDEILSLWEQAA